MLTVDELACELHIKPEVLKKAMNDNMTDYFVETNMNQDNTITKELEAAIKKLVNTLGLQDDPEVQATTSDTEGVVITDGHRSPVLGVYMPEPVAEPDTSGATTNVDPVDSGDNNTVGTIDEPVKQESEPVAKTRTRRKSVPKTDDKTKYMISSDIDKMPAGVLRLFMAENMNIKPEKIFFMDDAAVRAKIDEKYAFIEREDDYIAVKKGTAVISVKKEM